MSEQPRQNRFTGFIDLTTKAQREETRDQILKTLAEPEPALPDATVEELPSALHTALRSAGWESLMPVQQKAIPYMLEGRDLIVQSRTGSGKTGAFLLPLFQLLSPTEKEVQALVMTPTRELAKQVFEEFERMNSVFEGDEKLGAVSVYGGVRYGPQNQALRGGAQVVIGTPGRILDHLERGTFQLRNLRVLIMDEADEMLSMGFYPAMKQLRRYLPRDRQSYMFSATMPHRVKQLAEEFLHDPGFLSLSVGQVSVDAIEHRYYVVNAMQKDRALARLIEMENPDSAIVFANTKRDVEYVSSFLINYGYDAAQISGDLSQRDREQVMARVRRNDLRFLIATDVAARGIDISDLSHVIMYDIPQDPEYYIHRAGRTARAGKTGTAIVLCSPSDERSLLGIARRYDITLTKHPEPMDEDVQARVSERMTIVLEEMMRTKTNLQKERQKRFIPLVEELAREEPDILAMLVDEIYHRQLHQPPPSPDAEKTSPSEAEEEDKIHYTTPRPADAGGGGRRQGGGRQGGRGRK
jgi:ATP-dependent RNA helicase DeaD